LSNQFAVDSSGNASTSGTIKSTAAAGMTAQSFNATGGFPLTMPGYDFFVTNTSGTGDILWQATTSGKTILHCLETPGYCQSPDYLWLISSLAVANTSWDSNGLKHEGGTAPTASAGTMTGTNAGGFISGLSAATSVTITFANGGWTSWASCTASPSVSLSAAPYVSAISKTAVTFTFPSLTGKLYYQCNGN
jgi:hypothetical protein